MENDNLNDQQTFQWNLLHLDKRFTNKVLCIYRKTEPSSSLKPVR